MDRPSLLAWVDRAAPRELQLVLRNDASGDLWVMTRDGDPFIVVAAEEGRSERGLPRHHYDTWCWTSVYPRLVGAGEQLAWTLPIDDETAQFGLGFAWIEAWREDPLFEDDPPFDIGSKLFDFAP